MDSPGRARETADGRRQRLAIARFGYVAALGTGVMTLVSFGIAIFTPPLSGSLCREGCIEYPFLDIAARFPRDYVWMFPAIVATLFYVALMIALHARAADERRPLASFAVALSAMAALVLVVDYFVQLSVIQPSVLAGETDGIALLTQYNPHGLFIALEEVGYLLMSVSLACMAPAVSRATRLERVARWLFVGGLVVNVLAFAWISLRLGHARGYLFEIAVISVNWLVLVVAAFMLAAVFHRDAHAEGPR
jgi:hypothetical protein